MRPNPVIEYLKWSNVVAFITLLIISDTSFAQDTLRIRVLDKKSEAPVAYAIVASGNGPKMYADVQGYCSVPVSDLKESISVRCIGYADYSISAAKIPKSKIIYLTHKEVPLAEANVTSKKPIRADYIKQSHTYLQGAQLPFSSEYCTFVPLPSGGWKKIVTIRIKMDPGAVENPVRLHLYDADAAGFPDHELLLASVMIGNKDVESGEYLLSVADRNIRIDKDKIFIGIEWPGLSHIREEDVHRIGPRVRMAESISEQRTFSRNDRARPWRLLPVFEKKPKNMLVSVDYLSEE